MGINLLAIAYEGHPSTRLRFEQYVPRLSEDGTRVTTVLLPSGTRGQRQHVERVSRAAADADVVLVQRVLLGWLNDLLRASRKPVVFDLDDAVQYIRPSQLERTDQPRSLEDLSRVLYRRLLRGSKYHSSRRRHLHQMLSLCRAAIVGNRFLRDEIAGAARCQLVVLPTSVPTQPGLVKDHRPHTPVTLGWVGLRDNLVHLRTLEPAFRALSARFNGSAELHVVTSEPYASKFVPTRFTRWSLEREGDIVRDFDVGLMPLVDDRFSRGKSAFKAILCMSYGVPVVISPVGVNAELVRSGWNGFLASTLPEWESALARLIEDHELRRRLGRNAFETIERGFSTERAYPVLKSVIERAANGLLAGDVPAGQPSGAI